MRGLAPCRQTREAKQLSQEEVKAAHQKMVASFFQIRKINFILKKFLTLVARGDYCSGRFPNRTNSGAVSRSLKARYTSLTALIDPDIVRQKNE